MGIKLTGFDELLEKLDKLSDKGRVDEIAKKAVDAARGYSGIFCTRRHCVFRIWTEIYGVYCGVREIYTCESKSVWSVFSGYANGTSSIWHSKR